MQLENDIKVFVPPLFYGLADKPFHEMTKEERQKAASDAMVIVRYNAFSRGLPILYSQKGLIIAEYSDGRRFLVEDHKITEPYND